MNIKELRKQHDLTQQQLADMLSVDIMTIRRWEYDKNKPSPMALKLLQELFPKEKS